MKRDAIMFHKRRITDNKQQLNKASVEFKRCSTILKEERKFPPSKIWYRQRRKRKRPK